MFKLRPTITPRDLALLEKAAKIEKNKTSIVRKGGLTLAACMALAEDVFAQATDPWTQAVSGIAIFSNRSALGRIATKREH